MKRIEAVKVVCIVDSRLAGAIHDELAAMGVAGYFAERAKQVSMKTRRGLFGPRTVLVEAPSEIVRFHVPRGRENEAMVRLAVAADLFLPGRGSLFAEPVSLALPDGGGAAAAVAPLAGETPSWVRGVPLHPSPHDLIWCVVQRGRAAELSLSLLEMGLCVPIVSYGEGRGLRDRLGLLRITIPRDKEILMAIVPAADSEFVVDVMVRKARLREPGRGYLCRARISALLTNTRMYHDPRRHVASMEQVISTLDMLRGSTDWRRLPYAGTHMGGAHARALARLSLVCEEGTSERPLAVALEAGAGGATQSLMIRHDASEAGDGARGATASHARERCDLVVPRSLALRIGECLADDGFFADPGLGFVEISPVIDAVSASAK